MQVALWTTLFCWSICHCIIQLFPCIVVIMDLLTIATLTRHNCITFYVIILLTKLIICKKENEENTEKKEHFYMID